MRVGSMRGMAAVLIGMLAAAGAAAAKPADVARLKAIVVAGEPSDRAKQAAAEIQKTVEQYYGVKPALIAWDDFDRIGETADSFVFLGRDAAIKAGAVSARELERLKYDGYVLRVRDGNIHLAGYNDRGLMFGTYALLERLGVKTYGDGRMGIYARVFSPVKAVPETDVATKPFFEYRDPKDQWWAKVSVEDTGSTDGRSAKVLNPELFNPRLSGVYQSSQHSATYLVPPQLYYDEHPEYYALRGGKRIPKDTRLSRTNLCLSNPDVAKITLDRALQWIELQKERRFFWIYDQDGEVCRCDACAALDPRPGYATDRTLAWSNVVARAVARKYPEKLIFSASYQGTAPVPFNVKPEPNTVVFYCPWFRDSRNCNGHTWACHENIGAMKQFMDWLVRYPNQMAVYDYGLPASTDRNKSDLIKFFAKNRVRGIYYDGRPEDLLPFHVHITRNMMWDPYQDSAALQDEFLRDCFGPAAPFMGRYLDAVNAVVEDGDTHYVPRRGPAQDPAFAAMALDLFVRAGKAVEQGMTPGEERREPNRKEQILGRLDTEEAGLLAEVLKAQREAGIRTQADLDAYRSRVARGISLGLRRIRANQNSSSALERECATVRAFLKEHAGEAGEKLAAMEFLQGPDRRKTLNADAVAAAERLAANPAEILKGFAAAAPPVAAPKETVPATLSFSGEAQAKEWAGAGPAGIPVEPRIMTVRNVVGTETRGTGATFALTRLPKDAATGLQTGSLSLKRSFARPLDVSAARSVDLAIFSSAPAPLTVYVETEKGIVRVNTQIFPGEQIVRVDLNAFRTGAGDGVASVECALSPQGNFPQPATWDPAVFMPTRDVAMVIMSVTVRSRVPAPAELGPSAIWMSRSRSSNINRTVGDKGTEEPFRGYQRDAGLHPLRAVVVPKNPSDAETQAAGDLRGYLQRVYGVALPVVPEPDDFSDAAGNAVFVGKRLGLRSGLVRELELAYVGAQGFVLHGEGGRIAVAGADDEGLLAGVARFLEDQGVGFLGGREDVPDRRGKLVREIYLLDRPSFAVRPIGGWRLRGSAPAPRAGGPNDLETVVGLIKDAARRGETAPPAFSVPTRQADLFTYVVANLLWDPFQDVSRLKRRFARSGGEGS